MQYYRCKCGHRESWGSLPPDRCQRCEKCGSDLAFSPESHREPIEHDFSAVNTVETDDGPKLLTRCRYCYRTKAEVQASEGEKA